MQAITYSLKGEDLPHSIAKKNSEEYYRDLRVFTGEVLLHADNSLKPLALDFIEYIRKYGLEEVREIEEYILELLSFGVLWRVYAATALKIQHAPFITLSLMAEWRKKHQRLKPSIDFARGILMTLFLLPKNLRDEYARVPTLEQIDHVCKWFEATGEFREQALRFIMWRAFWGTKDPAQLSEIFYTIEQFTQWFDERSKEALGKYTQNVEYFLRTSRKRYMWREDRISCTRSRLEYHLNMVGAELMNRAFRTDYNDTDEKVVLLPGCVRYHTNDECKAVKVKEGLLCEGCTPKCRVNQIREMGKNHSGSDGFDVYIIPHASDLSLWSPKDGRPRRGVIASACVSTLVEGGWELKRYDVPAQCVPLDYSGCKKHWRCEGVSTELSIRELKRIAFN